MRKLINGFLALLFVLAILSVPGQAKAESSAHSPAYASASDLIAGVNAVRSSAGLGYLQENSILDSIAQQQAAYELSIGSQTDTGPGGSHPYQRALAAGYLLGGNLSNGGFIAELLYGGVGIAASAAVSWWDKDSYHHSMLVSTAFEDVGAGAASSGNTVYFVLVEATSTGGTPVVYTPATQFYQPVATSTIVPNTPNPDGSIVHIVQPGETLGSLSMAYNVPLSDILILNGLTIKSTIFVNEKITIQKAYTATPTQATFTPTIPPTSTPWPTSTFTATPTGLPATPTLSPGLPVSAAGGAMCAIVVSALILAGLIALLGRKR
jgi:uncharacterized protein YkwD